MRVLAVHPGAEMYGSDRMFLAAVDALCDAGAEVRVILPEHGELAGLLRAAGARVAIQPQFVIRKELLRPREWLAAMARAVVAMARAVRAVRQWRPDVLYVSTITLPTWPVVGRILRVPIVVHLHEAESQASAVVRRLLYAPLGGARAIIANSAFSLDVAAREVSTARKVGRVVPNGVAGPPEVSPPRETVTDGIRVVYVGRLSERKGPDTALAAVEELVQRGVPASLSIVGDVFRGNEAYGEHLAARAARSRAHVRLIGFQRSVWTALAAADVAVVPSRTPEPFGNTAVEARLAARPVIVTDIGGLPEAVSGSPSAVVVPPDDPGALADALAEVALDWSRLSKAAVQDALVAAVAYDVGRFGSRVVEVIRRSAR